MKKIPLALALSVMLLLASCTSDEVPITPTVTETTAETVTIPEETETELAETETEEIVMPMSDEYKPKTCRDDAERSVNIVLRGKDSYKTKSDPKLITLESSGEYIVADAIVTEAPFYADPTGQYDSTTAIQNAINSVHNNGGGTVYIPAGEYLITSPLKIKSFVSVIGEYRDPDIDDLSEGYGTVFVADVESTEDEMPALITVGGSAGVRGLTVYYPNQSADDVKPYPYTFYIPGHGTGGDPTDYMLMTIRDVTVINGYRGILASKYNDFVNEQFYIINFKGTFLERGLELYNCADASAVQNVTLSPKYWAEASGSFSKADEDKIRTVTDEDAIGYLFSDVEWSAYSNIAADGYHTGMNIIKGIRAEFNGAIYNLNLTDCTRGLNVEHLDTRSGFGLGVIGGRIEGSEYAVSNTSGGMVRITDAVIDGSFEKRYVEVIDTELEDYPEAGLRIVPTVTRAALYVLEDADSSGIRDCSESLQSLLDKAAEEGGGVVYVPAGYYALTSPITVPEGVDLRGAGSLPMRDEFNDSLGTVFFASCGKGAEDPENAQALITLEKNASLRNVRMLYNHTDVLSDYNKNGDFTYYPFMIRGTGENVSVVNVAMLSPVYGIEMKNADGYCIEFVTSGAYNETIRITDSVDGYIGFVLNNVTTNFRHAFWKSKNYSKLFPNGWETSPETELDSKTNSFYMAMDNLEIVRMIHSSGRLEHVFTYAAKNLLLSENSTAEIICIGRDCWWKYEVGESNAVIVSKDNSDVSAYGIQRFNGVTYTTDGTGRLLAVGRVAIGYREMNELVENGKVTRLK